MSNKITRYGHKSDSQIIDSLRAENAALRAEVEAKRLRGALEEFVNGADECLDDDEWTAMVVSMETYHICEEAISSPTSTEALDAYVAEAKQGKT